MSTAVIGAGPAGMLAALAATIRDPDVILIDEHDQLGGHLRYDQYVPGDPESIGSGWLDELKLAIAASQAVVHLNSIVWAGYRTETGFELSVNIDGSPETIRVDSVVIATGTTDIELNVPGATVPGVLTERAARILIELHGVVPGGRFVIAGVDQARIDRLRAHPALADRVVATYAPLDINLIGNDDGVSFVRAVDSSQVEADVVVLATGERPDLQLAGMLGVSRRFDVERNGWFLDVETLPAGCTVVGGARLGACTPAELIADAITSGESLSRVLEIRDLPLTNAAINATWSPS